jgi:hypothetical protein
MCISFGRVGTWLPDAATRPERSRRLRSRLTPSSGSRRRPTSAGQPWAARRRSTGWARAPPAGCRCRRGGTRSAGWWTGRAGGASPWRRRPGCWCAGSAAAGRPWRAPAASHFACGHGFEVRSFAISQVRLTEEQSFNSFRNTDPVEKSHILIKNI